MRSLGGAIVVYLLTCVFGRAGLGLALLAAADAVVARLVLREIGARRRDTAMPPSPSRAAAPLIAPSAEPS